MRKKVKWLWIIAAFASIVVVSLYTGKKYRDKDTEPPAIKCESDFIRVGIDASDEELKAGITATDNKDGDLTDQIFIESINKKETEENKHIFDINYIVFDSSSNVSRISRQLQYIDYYSPHFELTRQLRFASTESFSIFDYVQVKDCKDGDISSQVTLEGDKDFLDSKTPGVYDCEFRVVNSLGDSAVLPTTVVIYEDTLEASQSPTISLNKGVVYLNKGEAFNPEDYIDWVAIRNNKYPKKEFVRKKLKTDSIVSWKNFTIDSSVNTSKAGCYNVEYTYQMPVKKYKGHATLIVVVEE